MIKQIIRFVGWILIGFGNLFTWLFLPPIFLFISKPIKKLWIRCVLCVVSPMTIYLCCDWYDSWERKYRYSYHKDIEEFIGFDFPAFETTNYEERFVSTHLVRGYKIKRTIKFNKLPTNNFYHLLDSLCDDDSCWTWHKFKKEHELKLDSLITINEELLDTMDNYAYVEYMDKLDSIAKLEFANWDSLTQCYEFYNGTVYVNLEKGNNIATIEYDNLKVIF